MAAARAAQSQRGDPAPGRKHQLSLKAADPVWEARRLAYAAAARALDEAVAASDGSPRRHSDLESFEPAQSLPEDPLPEGALPNSALPDGVYLISTVKWPDWFLFHGSGSMCAVYSSREEVDDTSKWRLTNVGGGFVELRSVAYPKFCLAVWGLVWDRVWGMETADPGPKGRFRVMQLQRESHRVDVAVGGAFGLAIDTSDGLQWCKLSDKGRGLSTLGTALGLCHGKAACQDAACALIFHQLIEPPWTFDNSEYKMLLEKVEKPKTSLELWMAFEATVDVLSTLSSVDPRGTLATLRESVTQETEALQRDGTLTLVGNPVEQAKQVLKCDAMHLWTSEETHGMFDGRPREFCWLLNMLIRLNDVGKLALAMPIVKALNLHCAGERRSKVRADGWDDHKCYRGSGFNMAYKFFFKNGVMFRTTGFIATSQDISVAKGFMKRVSAPLQPIQWTFHIDTENKCWHVNLMNHTMVPGELEFLFSPFSTFTVRAVHWAEGEVNWLNPHKIELAVHPDNQLASKTVPLAPWM